MFVCRFTDSESHRRNALLRMEPALPDGSRPPRAGRRDPFRAPDTDPSLGRAPGEFALQGSRGPQNGGLGRSCTLTELGVCVAVMRTGGLRFFRLVPHRTTPYSRLLNIESLVVSLLREADIARCPETRLNRTRNRTRVSQIEGDKLTTSEIGPDRAAGSSPGCAKREIENFSDGPEPGLRSRPM